jgi:hypothetical protein
MMLFGSSKPEPTRISLQLPDQPVVVRSRTKRRRASSSSSRAAYNFDTDAEADARDAALTAIASLARRVDETLRRLEADDHLRPVPLLREAVAPYLENGAADAHDAALRAFFAPAAEAKGEDHHVPTMAMWALASIGRVYPERMLHICQRTDEEECALFAAQAHGYYTALHVALYTRRPETFYARRQFIRSASARIAEVLEEQGGCDDVRTWLHHPR